MSLLDGYLTRSELATELNVHIKTIKRWENLPNGLPYTMMGGRKLYKKSSVLAWIDSREHRPNPRRNVRIKRRPAGTEAA